MTIQWPTTGAEVATSLRWAADRADELEDFAAVAVSKIEEKVGPWHGQPLTFTVALHQAVGALDLPWPIGDFPTVTVNGSPVVVAAVDLDPGVVYGHFPPGTVVVTAVARPTTTCPPEIKLASRRLAAHLAKQELVGPRGSGFTGGPDKDIDVQQGFALPRAVSELIADYVRPGGFA